MTSDKIISNVIIHFGTKSKTLYPFAVHLSVSYSVSDNVNNCCKDIGLLCTGYLIQNASKPTP